MANGLGPMTSKGSTKDRCKNSEQRAYVTKSINLALHRGRQMRDGEAYGCAVPRAYANLNPGLKLKVKVI